MLYTWCFKLGFITIDCDSEWEKHKLTLRFTRVNSVDRQTMQCRASEFGIHTGDFLTASESFGATVSEKLVQVNRQQENHTLFYGCVSSRPRESIINVDNQSHFDQRDGKAISEVSQLFRIISILYHTE